MRPVLLVLVAGLAGAADPFLTSLRAAPAVLAAQERVHAAEWSAGAAGRLPDPMLSAGYSRRRNAADAWPIYGVGVEQGLPRWGERDARRAQAASAIALAEAEQRELIGDLAAEVAGLLADTLAARARMVLLDGQLARATALQASLSGRVASGGASLAESLAVQSRIAAVTIERDTARRQAEDAEQEVRARLGLAPDVALPSFTAPEVAAVDLERVPAVQLAQAKAGEAIADADAARAGGRPETAVGLRYEREQVPGEPEDTIGLEVRVSLPVWSGAVADQEGAALARQRAAGRDAQAEKARANSLLGRAQRAAAVAAAARAAAQATQGRLEAEYASLVRTAAAQGGSLLMVLEVLDRLAAAEAQIIDAEAAARQAAASLWRLAPPDPLSERTAP